MVRFPTLNLFIEGPDLSGKSSLIKELHSQTQYKRHIFDRSQISRKIFCDLYERDYELQHLHMDNEVCNLNNRFFFLLPEKKEILKRFSTRGDEIHDLSSLLVVYDQFSAFLDSYHPFPNIYNFKNSDLDIASLANCIDCILNDLEEISSLDEISDHVFSFVNSSSQKEIYPLSFFLIDDGKFELADSTILEDEKEGDYYHMIYKKIISKIKRELEGDNPYNRKETLESRRFVFSDETCISFIQAANRNGIFDFHVVLRSSDVKDIFPSDLKFLYYLMSVCYQMISNKHCMARLRINLNSAHILE